MKKMTDSHEGSIADILAKNWDYIKEHETVDLEELSSSEEMRTAIRELIREENLSTVNRITGGRIKTVNTFYSRYGKRALDILISSAALAFTLPINGVLCICTYLDVGSPVLFRQKRVGKGEREFEIVKFRNMTNKTDENGNLLPPKDRVTKFGKIVRKLSLDELLNFWSVLKGDMSIIGPRPLVSVYQPFMSRRHRSRSNVRPGLECPILNDDGTKRTWLEQFENDVYYVEHVSLKLDCQMLSALVKAVFDRKSSKMRGDARRGSFMGYSKDGNSINSLTLPSVFLIKLAEKNGGNVEK